ncbi:cupin domain-containing protein [Roseibium litorale]|uniref:Cupin domain-containing protein n=1 Tax=Roseibium litorale TaxID=2803841 RepID=A0ABR9CJP5_9HYPH|nr:cupin domain-containing protein [Roseibium litorale]MBD8890958.1 cupin domain-containing protein [Roseibium litorale]
MSLIKTLDHNPDFTPVHALPAPERLISGSPEFDTWAMDESREGKIKSGIWQATPGLTRSIKGETFEFCHILEGLVEITEDGGETYTYKAGDSFVMKPGFVGTWHTIETVRKIYVVCY